MKNMNISSPSWYENHFGTNHYIQLVHMSRVSMIITDGRKSRRKIKFRYECLSKGKIINENSDRIINRSQYAYSKILQSKLINRRVGSYIINDKGRNGYRNILR